MPVISAAQAPTFELPGIRFTGLAAPSRGSAESAVWIRLIADGKYVYSGTLNPGQIRNVDADTSVELRLGDAGGASITLNGKLVSVEGFRTGVMGPAGQVRTFQFTSGGFQIVLPKAPESRDPR